ncbi:MAG: right-handed parallel beta-helix repeat-containing protein [Pseudonocardia sp.]|uniref:right-handed parallel beta-helix repeat-containing protein n=1 Tax=unclassified Pseudonocardia TaxID=2619320 RepID=UPI000AE46C15|nr:MULTISPECIES: right-handed parallel beta-helix repeat-containing protein [unclassified Pseudonocardia]MBN9111928.1 right-handed parallel beta-helix repeat-containing protein [Pseudonocardia sp.]
MAGPRARRSTAAAALLAALLVSSCSALGGTPGDRTFYVSPTGDDAARGTSEGTAWRTLDRASSVRLVPGDRLLLEGGATFAGRLRIDAEDAGDPAKPVVVGSYGEGRARIQSDQDSAVLVLDTGGVRIGDLVVVGPGRFVAGSAGVRLYNDLPGGRMLDGVTVTRVDASGFVNGVEIGAANTGAGFRDAVVDDVVAHDNRDAGLAVYGPELDPAAPAYAHEGLTVSRVTAFGNRGDPANSRHNTGSGIVVGSVRGATVSGSVAHDNGGSGGSGEGPVGIWTYDSDGVVIEHSLSYRNRTARKADGGGFGLDQNTSNSVMQYNLSYDNHGPGYLVYTGQDNAVHRGSVVRFNISSGDARRWSIYGGITVLGRTDDVRVHHNTVVMAPQAGDPSSALRLGPGISGVVVRDNVFVSRGAGPLVVAEQDIGRDTAVLAGNAYVADGVPWSVRWGGAVFGTPEAWRAATGQETEGGVPTGIVGDPLLPGPLVGLTATAADDRAADAGFVPGAGSPLLGAGLDVTALVAPQTALVDRTGAPVPLTGSDVGAMQRP